MGVKKRQLQTNLRIFGLAFIVLGLWTVIKFVAQTVMDYLPMIREYVKQQGFAAQADQETTSFWMQFGFTVFVVVLCVLIFLLHFYIGRSAMKDARGHKKNHVYLVVAILYFIFSIATYVYSFLSPDLGWQAVLADIFIDLTLYICILAIVILSLKLKKLREAEIAEAGAAA